VRCNGYSHHAFVFNNRIDPASPADTDPQPANNQATVNLDIECVVPIKIVLAPNLIRTSGNMPIPVAIFSIPGGTPELPLAFDPATIDPATVRFGPRDLIWAGGGGAAEYHSTNDQFVGTRRLQIYHFRQKATGLQRGQLEACVKGVWHDPMGNAHTFFGCDEVRVW